MRILLATVVILCISFPAIASESPCISNPPLIREIVKAYSDRTGQEFVLDPRVRAKVQSFGIEIGNVDYDTLIGILQIHGFAAFDWKGVTYVVPEVVLEPFKEKLLKSES